MCCGKKKLAGRNTGKRNLGKKSRRKQNIRRLEPMSDPNLTLPINQDNNISITPISPPYDVHLA